MPRHTLAVVLGLLLVAPDVLAQAAVDAGQLEQGRAIFETECALCHQADGAGDPPTFPALSGNTNLGDVAKIVTNIHQGQGNMPPFPDFGPEQIAAAATYIRNSWGNAFGGVSVEDVTGAMAGTDTAAAGLTVWGGVYTAAQAQRGKDVYMGVCSSCHGSRLDGAADDPDMRSSPPLARAKFLRNWDGRSLATLVEFTRATMPSNNPGFLTDRDYVDIVAHMLASSNLPEGQAELPTEPAGLADIAITEKQP